MPYNCQLYDIVVSTKQFYQNTLNSRPKFQRTHIWEIHWKRSHASNPYNKTGRIFALIKCITTFSLARLQQAKKLWCT